MTVHQKIEAAEAASLASQRLAGPRHAPPSSTLPCAAQPCSAKPHPYLRKLARVLEAMGSLYLVQDILNAVNDRKMQMFAVNDSIAITQIVLFPRAKVLEIIAVVGNLEDSRVLHDRVLAFAATVGANVVQAYGRKGWVADAKQRGWKVKARSFVYQKEL